MCVEKSVIWRVSNRQRFGGQHVISRGFHSFTSAPPTFMPSLQVSACI